MGDWLQEIDLGQALQTAMAATNTHFVQPAADVIAALAADTPTAKFFKAFKFVLQSTLSRGFCIAVRYDDTPPTLASLVDPASGVTIFKTTAIDAGSINLLHLGVIGQPTLDMTAARAASVARFGPIGSVVVVARTANAHVLRCLPALDGLLERMAQENDRANNANNAGIPALLPPPDNAVGGRATAMFLRSTPAKETAVRRLMENLALAPDHSGARQLFTNLLPTDAITLDISGAYDISAIIVRIRTMMRLAAKGIEKDEVKLTDDQWRRLLLLQDPPLDLLNTAAMLAADIGPDTFSDMVAKAAHILGLVYGKPLDDAVNGAGVALAHLAKTDSAKALKTGDLFTLLSKRLTTLFASPLIYNGGATEAIRARPLTDRVAEALLFTEDSKDFKAALEEAKSAAHRKEIADLRQELRQRPPTTQGQGTGKGGKNGTKRDRNGNKKVGNGPTDPAASQAWRAKKPPGDHLHVDLPCFYWVLNMAPCKNQPTCKHQRNFRHNVNWDNGLTAGEKKAYLAWFKSHPDMTGTGPMTA